MMNLKEKLDLSDFFYPRIRSGICKVTSCAIDLLAESRLELLNAAYFNSDTKYLRAIANVQLKNCVSPEGQMSLNYFLLIRNGKSTIRDLTARELSSIKRFFVSKELCRCIEALWDQLRREPSVDEDKLLFPIGKRLRDLTSLTSKELRLAAKPATPIVGFKLGTIMTINESLSYFLQLNKLTSVKHKCLLLRVLHGDIYTNERLFRFGLRPNPTCDRCDEPDTIVHRLVSCSGTESLRRELTGFTQKLFKTISIRDLDPLDMMLATHKDSTTAMLSLHAEFLQKIIGTDNLPRDSRQLAIYIIRNLCNKERKGGIKRELELLLESSD